MVAVCFAKCTEAPLRIKEYPEVDRLFEVSAAKLESVYPKSCMSADFSIPYNSHMMVDPHHILPCDADRTRRPKPARSNRFPTPLGNGGQPWLHLVFILSVISRFSVELGCKGVSSRNHSFLRSHKGPEGFGDKCHEPSLEYRK